ncbi:MAG: hypothetical protein L0G63_01205 [Psychrobacter sp.]|uniref:phage tail tube protein n=1 Tax=Psychrobacter sp. TaxID=56811 RepID=UPI002647499F|nr:hypothetical protein [Psychrobacter sp.]MDN5619087.1 hypothetical protein [Psychrobacter sp.]
MAQRGKKYSGDLYARKWGTNDGFLMVGNVTELTTSKESEKDQLTSTGRGEYGEVIDSDSKPGTTELSIKFNTFDKLAMARVMMGEAVDLETAPVTITDEPLTVTTGWIKLAHRDIDPATFVLSDTEDTPNVIEATQYELNPRLGMIRFNETATPVADSTVTYSGTTLGRAGYMIDANTLSSLPLEMYLDGKDRISGADGILDMPHGDLSSDSEINWMSDDWWEGGLSGPLIKDPGKPTMRFTEYK